MSVRIQLDRPHAHFTNLDIISGKCILSLLGSETISGITVKLEGESRTRLAGYANPRGAYDGFERDQTQLELHKLLYKVSTVFPTPDLVGASSRSQYTLPPGQHVYNFKFKLPFNNDCIYNNSIVNSLNALRMDTAMDMNQHVKQTLPPSLNGLPGQAEIRYYVKATVQRPAFYKENFRCSVGFTFLPIEPPRPPPNKRESYARRSHHFAPSIDVPTKPSLFRKNTVAANADSGAPKVPSPNVSIDGRLPDPPLITCNEPLPLRILITKKNQSPATIYLQLLNIELLAYTNVRAHQLRRQEVTSWTIMSSSGMRTALNKNAGGESSRDGSNVFEVDSKLWKQHPIPNTVCPSFATCNVSRSYALDVKVGLSWGSPGNINPELTVQPIRMPVEVYSGIAPPQALLSQMANRPNTQPASNTQASPPSRLNSSLGTPSRPPNPPPSDHIEPSPSDIPDEAPPSYEDAMADDLAPIDGPRRDYHQPSQPPSGTDSKGSGPNDRLFPESGQ